MNDRASAECKDLLRSRKTITTCRKVVLKSQDWGPLFSSKNLFKWQIQRLQFYDPSSKEHQTQSDYVSFAPWSLSRCCECQTTVSGCCETRRGAAENRCIYTTTPRHTGRHGTSQSLTETENLRIYSVPFEDLSVTAGTTMSPKPLQLQLKLPD